MPANLLTRHLGLMPYGVALETQAAAAAEVRSGAADGVVLSVRHPPVITLGRRASPGEVHADRETLGAAGIELFQVDRGGGATYHYPDQAVVYPILDLERLRISVPRLLRSVGDAVLDVLAGAGVTGAAWDPDRPGVYLGPAKIASIGFHLSKGLTTHGVALNVGPGWDDGFRRIDPCKVRGQPVTAMSEHLPARPDAEVVTRRLADAIVRRLA